jgi:hypothetical protein
MKVTGKIVNNFTLEEMACRDGTLHLTPDAVRHAQMVQELREWYNKPMTVNSWYRSLEYNRTLGDSTDNSQHVKGTATDIGYPKEFHSWSTTRKREFIANLKTKWFEICKKYGVEGAFGIYPGFYHIDSRPKRAQWDFSSYFK